MVFILVIPKLFFMAGKPKPNDHAAIINRKWHTPIFYRHFYVGNNKYFFFFGLHIYLKLSINSTIPPLYFNVLKQIPCQFFNYQSYIFGIKDTALDP